MEYINEAKRIRKKRRHADIKKGLKRGRRGGGEGEGERNLRDPLV